MMEEPSMNDFEKSLKDSAGTYSTPPSDKVWEGVYRELHPARRINPLWWAAAVLLLLAGGIYGITRYGGGSTKPVLVQGDREAGSPAATPDSRVGSGTAVSGKAPGALPSAGSRSRSVASAGMPPPMKNPVTPAKPSAFAGVTGVPAENTSPMTSFRLPLLNNLSFRSHESGELSGLGQPFPLFFAGSGDALPSPVQTDEQLVPRAAGAKNPKAAPDRKIRITLFYTPAVGYRFLKKEETGVSFSVQQAQALNSFASQSRSPRVEFDQRPDWAWSVGAHLSFPVGRSWSVQTGLALTKTGYGMEVFNAIPTDVRQDGLAYAPTSGNGFNSSYSSYQRAAAVQEPTYFHNRYLTGEIPLMMKRQFGNPRKVTLEIGAGVGFSYMLASNALIYSPKSGRYFSHKQYLRAFNGNLHFQSNILVPLAPGFRLSVGPSVQYQVLSTYQHYKLVNEHPYLLGIQTGLVFGQ